MHFRAMLQRANFTDQRHIYIALTLPVIGLVVSGLVVGLASTQSYLSRPRIFRAPPQRYVDGCPGDEVPYPPDALPGGRNVDSPYGNIRVYEWGPREGRKVLFLHGISTPCIALARLAKLLECEGCRVLLFDLFGRGYSDAPDPRIHRQDIGLFSAQILSAIASSPLDWTAGFTLVGYSLGGGIAAGFASYYPGLVASLVLIAPGGLLRRPSGGIANRLLYSGLLPDAVVHWWVGRKLRAGGPKRRPRRLFAPRRPQVDVTNAAAEELPPEHGAYSQDSEFPLFGDRKHVSPATAVAWQLRTHAGFVPSFVSSVMHAPIRDGHERWQLVGRRCEAHRTGSRSNAGEEGVRGLAEGMVLVILGRNDAAISSAEIAEDAVRALGADNVRVVQLTAGHDLPISHSDACAGAMLDFWAAKPGSR